VLTLLNDLPEEGEAKLWPGMEKLAERLAHLIPHLPLTSPVLVSGDWGSGKTTLLKAVERKIPEDRRIFFEAWRYEAEALLLPALLRAIWKKLPEDKRKEKASLAAKIFETALTLSLSLGGSLAKLAGGPAPLVVEALFGFYEKEKKDAAQPQEPPKDVALALQEDFSKLVSGAWTEEAPLIVFVDDLDRCGPECAVRLLEALRMLLHQTATTGKLPCRFVVALDRKVLTHAVALKYEGVNRYEGNRYLEKLFPFSFELPQPQGGEVHQLIEKILGDQQGGENEGNERDALATALAEAVFANPRLIKRCVNRFRLILEFEKEDPRAVQHPAESLETLARWIAAVERWPNLRRLLASRDEAFWRQLREALAAPNGAQLDADVRALLQEDGVEAWMRTTFLSVRGDQISAYQEANRRLRAWGL